MKSSRSLIISLTLLAIFFMAIQPELFTYHTGAPSGLVDGGYTGGTFEGGRLCTACHAGTAQYRDLLISTNVPSDGYVPGVSYSVNIHIYEPGITRFGFEASPQNNTGADAGLMSSIDFSTQMSTNPNYITHTSAGIDYVDSASWTFDWMAPAVAGTGPVNFFVAVNATNHDNTNSGDQIYFDTVTIQENVLTGITETNSITNQLTVYPTITNDWVFIGYTGPSKSAYARLYDMNGHLVLDEQLIESGTNSLNLSDLSPGLFLLNLIIGAEHSTFRLLKQ